MTAPPRRQSDRWMTPTVIVTLLLVGGGLVALTVAAVTYLVAQGIDPTPVLDLPAKVGLAVGSLTTMVVTLSARAGTAKVERNTGVVVPDAIDQQTAALQDLTDTVHGVLQAHADLADAVSPYVPGQTGIVRSRPPVPQG